MKKLLLVLLFAVPAWAAELDFTFAYNYVTPGCLDTSDVDCVESFEMRDVDGGAVVGIATATPGANTPAIDIPLFATGYGRLGNRQFIAFAIGRTGTGARIESEASTLTIDLDTGKDFLVVKPDKAIDPKGRQK